MKRDILAKKYIRLWKGLHNFVDARIYVDNRVARSCCGLPHTMLVVPKDRRNPYFKIFFGGLSFVRHIDRQTAAKYLTGTLEE